MKLKLYDPFQSWQSSGVIWVFSDPHFNDPESKLMNPNWPDAETIVKNINAKVGKYDTLIILGDVGDVSYVSKLKGYKVLITGNHDRGVSNYQRQKNILQLAKTTSKQQLRIDFPSAKNITETENSYIVETDNCLFDEVYNGPLFINSKILLSHEPITLPFGINIHGHVHNGVEHIYTSGVSVSINMCSDVVNFEPMRLTDIVKGFNVQELHRTTIDKAVENKKKGK